MIAISPLVTASLREQKIPEMMLSTSINPLKRGLPMPELNCSKRFPETEPSRLPLKKRRLVAPAKKQVRFTSTPKVGLKIASRDEIASTWYPKQDQLRFKLDSKASIFALYRVGGDVAKLESQDQSIRGLENFLSPAIANDHRQARKDRIVAVLVQQQLQRATGTYNPEFLRLVSSLASEKSSQVALRRGVEDAEIWNELLL